MLNAPTNNKHPPILPQSLSLGFKKNKTKQITIATARIKAMKICNASNLSLKRMPLSV
jgi:hypothetical protein